MYLGLSEKIYILRETAISAKLMPYSTRVTLIVLMFKSVSLLWLIHCNNDRTVTYTQLDRYSLLYVVKDEILSHLYVGFMTLPCPINDLIWPCLILPCPYALACPLSGLGWHSTEPCMTLPEACLTQLDLYLTLDWPLLYLALPYPSLLISNTKCQNLRSLKAIACMYSLFITEVKLPFEASKLLFIPSKGIKFNIINLTFNKVLRNIKLCELNTKFNSFTLCSCNVKSLKRI